MSAIDLDAVEALANARSCGCINAARQRIECDSHGALRIAASALVARVRELEAGPDDAACDEVIEALGAYGESGYFLPENMHTELRAAIRAALKGE